MKARARCSPLHRKTLQFLNARREIPTYQSDIRSLWSILPGSLEPLVAKLLEGEENLELKEGDTITTASQQHKISIILRESRHQEHLEVWKRATDQGRCATHISLHPSSNHWLNTGNYLSFSAYNIDETGMPLNHRAPKVVTQKARKKSESKQQGTKAKSL